MYETQNGGPGGESSGDVEQIARVEHLHISVSGIERSVRVLLTRSVEPKSLRSIMLLAFPSPFDTAAMTRPL
jgi:hypothetical protein